MVNHRNYCSVMNTVMHRSDCMMDRSHSVMNTVVYSVMNRSNSMVNRSNSMMNTVVDTMMDWSHPRMDTMMNTNSVMHTMMQTSS